jgi:integrase/recombinase XerD
MKPLRDAIADYLALRRSLGFKLRATAAHLIDFASFLEQKAAPYITTALALEWAMQHVDHRPCTWAQRLGFVRVFARHWSATDPRTEIPPAGLLPFRGQRARPYLYTEQEVQSLLASCCQTPFTLQRTSTLDLSLFIRVVGSQWTAHQRGHQVGSPRRGF